MIVAKKQFSAAEVTRLWYSPMTSDAICRHLNCTKHQLYTVASRLKLPNRGHVKVVDGERSPGDPDEELIRHRAAKIQASWTPEVMARRQVGRIGQSKFRNYAFNGRNSTFAECGLP